MCLDIDRKLNKIRSLRYRYKINNILESNTALHYASEYGYYEIVELLLKKGSNYKIKNNKGLNARDLSQNVKIY
jgi:ankyrin repeat protein